MAISSRISSFSAPNLCNPTPSLSLSSAPISFRPMMSTKPEIVLSISAKGSLSSLRGGTGVLERPTFDQSQFDPIPEVEEGGDNVRLSDKKGLGRGDIYKVLLIDDARHTEALVEKALPEVVPSVSVAEARELFHDSRQHGVAIIIVTVKEHAEFYAQMMIRRGLRQPLNQIQAWHEVAAPTAWN